LPPLDPLDPLSFLHTITNPSARAAIVSQVSRDIAANAKATRQSDLRTQIRKCRECDLGRVRDKSVPFDGPTDGQADLILVGEAPGRAENRLGIPFVGPAGRILDTLLHQAGTDRSKCFVMNALCCWPGEGNPDPTDAQLKACRPNFLDQVEMGGVKVGVALGGYGISSVMGWPRHIVKVRTLLNRVFWVDGRIWVTTYHPAYALRNSARVAVDENIWTFDSDPDLEKPETANEIVKSLRWALAMRWGQVTMPKIPFEKVSYNGGTGEELGKALKKKRWALVDSRTFGCQIIVVDDSKGKKPPLPPWAHLVPQYTLDELWRIGEVGNQRGGWSRGDLRRLNFVKTEMGGEVVL